ncbi:MAG: OB-fold nucleic acid binding domain-containing protein [Calditrichia bacterium]
MKSVNTGIRTVRLGSKYCGFCVLRNQSVRLTRHGKSYLLFEVGDASGRSYIRFWKYGERERQIEVGAIIKVCGTVEQINNRHELQLSEWRPATSKEVVTEKTTLLPASKYSKDELRIDLQNHQDLIKNRWLRMLLRQLFAASDETEAFFGVPAGKLWHHAYQGGLLEHVVTMLDMATALARYNEAVDIDLLKTGVMCHDVARAICISDNGFYTYNDSGKLLGARVLSYQRVDAECKKIAGFPAELRVKLLHLILACSCPGESEEAFPKAQMVEAIILNHLIQTSAYSNAVCRIVTEGRLPGDKWTRYVNLLKRPLFFGIEPPDSGCEQV